jgi:hypothetical protein
MAKNPSLAQPAPEAKRPAASTDPNVLKHKPLSWGLKRLDLDCEWSWRDLDGQHIDTVHDELVSLEGRTLDELLRERKVKDIPINHLRSKPSARLKQLKLEEAEVLWELRLPNKWRAWGLVEGAVFYFLWWDEDEEVCHAPPKGQRRR